MTKKTLWFSVAVVALSGLAHAADVPATVVVPTALEPPVAVDLMVVSALAQSDFVLRESVFGEQAGLAVLKPFPRFRPSGDVEKTLFDFNLLALIGLNVADYVSTRQALKYPGLSEANPLMQPFVKSPAAFAAAKIGTTALTYWSMKVLFKKNRTVAWVLTTASNVLLSYVVANNLQRIHQARAL
jgi:hypothetical protein